MNRDPGLEKKASTLSRILRLAMIVSMASCFFMIVITMADVFSRHVFGKAIAGVFELSEVLMVVLVFLGLGFAQEEKSHIRAELLLSHLSARARRGFDLFAQVLSFLFWGVLLTQCTLKAIESFTTGEYKEGLMKFPMWPARWAIAAGLLLICLQLLKEICSALMSKENSAAEKG
jgi:TRAP-type C4-dicarboxylate transport system permease small subunit